MPASPSIEAVDAAFAAVLAETEALLADHGVALLGLARLVIAEGCAGGGRPIVDADAWPEAVGRPGACFVTLETGADGALRGCIGSLEAYRALVADVADNAFQAAFRDPRFPPVTPGELDAITITLSVLTPAQEMPVADRADLLAALAPGRDGLILADQGRRALFLPSVWDQLSDPRTFVDHLLRKAGLGAGHWSETLRAYRFRTVVVQETPTP